MQTSPKLAKKPVAPEQLPKDLSISAEMTFNEKELALIKEEGWEKYFDILETGVTSEAIKAAQTASQELDKEEHRANLEVLMQKLKHKIG